MNEPCNEKECWLYDEEDVVNCRAYNNIGNCEAKKPLTTEATGAKLQCSNGLVADLSLMLDIFNSCIETKTFPQSGSPCQHRILKLLKQSGRKPSASKIKEKGGSMDTARIYHDVEGNERTIHQMVKEEPVWAANRVQEGEKAIERVKLLERVICFIAREELGDMEFEDDTECLEYFITLAST